MKKKKKKKLTHEYILEEIKIANAILEVIDKEYGYNPEIKKKVKRDYFIAEIAPLIEVYKTK
tara:strand:+ start:1307 stop:1492 length:186 start_codon:yes stop_codon:yes gene_type:complete